MRVGWVGVRVGGTVGAGAGGGRSLAGRVCGLGGRADTAGVGAGRAWADAWARARVCARTLRSLFAWTLFEMLDSPKMGIDIWGGWGGVGLCWDGMA